MNRYYVFGMLMCLAGCFTRASERDDDTMADVLEKACTLYKIEHGKEADRICMRRKLELLDKRDPQSRKLLSLISYRCSEAEDVCSHYETYTYRWKMALYTSIPAVAISSIDAFVTQDTFSSLTAFALSALGVFGIYKTQLYERKIGLIHTIDERSAKTNLWYTPQLFKSYIQFFSLPEQSPVVQERIRQYDAFFVSEHREQIAMNNRPVYFEMIDPFCVT